MMSNPITPNSVHKEPYQVLAHTDKILIIQTNAGTELVETLDTQIAPINSFGCFNLGLHVNDDPAQVLHNRAQLLSLINEYLAQSKQNSVVDAIYWLSQIHSNQVVRLEEAYLDNLSLTPPAADALITAKSSQALAIMTADCAPLHIRPKLEASCSHSRRLAGINQWGDFETYNELNKFKSLAPNSMTESLLDAKPLQAWIGACITQACYEVSCEVVDKLLLGCEKKTGMKADNVRPQIVATHEDANKAWLDLPKVSAVTA